MHGAVHRILVITASILATTLALVVAVPSAAEAGVPATTSRSVPSATLLSSTIGTPGSGGYHVVGNQVLGPNGQQFIPYGFVVYCLAEQDVTCNDATTPTDPVPDTTKIRAAATYWHANVIRFQVAEQNLLPNGAVDPSFLARLTADVQLANSLGMVAIITEQEEYFDQPPLPVASAIPFWDAVSSAFKDDPMVFFDLYNEPRLGMAAAGSMDATWNLWRNGGTTDVGGTTYQFVGMQPLVDRIRADGATNVIIAEGLQADKDLSGLPRYVLNGSNLAYGMEPDLKSNDVTQAEWAANFGNLSDTVPVMMEAFQDWPGTGSCNTDSPTLVPQLLAYLHAKHLGLIAWALNPGVMQVGNNPENPTTYAGTTTQCPTATGKKHRAALTAALQSNTEGPGSLILAFFRGNSVPSPSGASGPAAAAPSTVVPTGGNFGTTRLLAAGVAALLVAAAAVAILGRRSRRRPLR